MLLILKDTKINLTMFVSFSIYTKALPIISNYVNSTQRDKRRHFSVCPYLSSFLFIQILYIPLTTRFHTFSFTELLYLYSKTENLLKSDSVILKKHFPCRKEVPHLMIVVLFVVKYIVCPIIVGRVLYLINQEQR